MFQCMLEDFWALTSFWIPLEDLVDLDHLCPEFWDLRVKAAFGHEAGKVTWSWPSLGDLLALGGDFVIEPGNMFSLLVRKLHQF